MRRISLILISLALVLSFAGCGKPQTGSTTFTTPLFRMTPDPKWHVYHFPGEFLDVKNAYTFTLLSYAPVQITEANQDQSLPYGFTIGSFYNGKVKEGEFDKETLAPIMKAKGIEPTVSRTTYISGVKCRWEEAKITYNNFNNIMIRIDIPLECGYIEIDAWGPADDEQLVEDFRELPKTLEITNKYQFKDHPEIGKRVLP
ncbi:MAG: hypothetical protein HGA95_04155 [Caldiserica bacterium]|nr:hypothetical protein [Caldisericota bacterium]